MLICLPGMESSVKRAATSATRCAPFVHHELHDDQHQEHDEADDVVAAHHLVADGCNDVARARLREDEARRRDVEAQPEQRRHQQQQGRWRIPAAGPCRT